MDEVLRLRTAVLRDTDGRVIEKPKPPPMRVVLKGAWTCRELPRDEADRVLAAQADAWEKAMDEAHKWVKRLMAERHGG